jgi:signal transduction histidine kinase
MADKNQLIRVFNNLIQNAVQAIGNNKDGSITIYLDKEGQEFLISVADNGPGIPDEMVDKIFSPSFTTKSSGMGLGLALVRSIIIEAGGSITFESSPDVGTTFFIRLPIYQDA